MRKNLKLGIAGAAALAGGGFAAGLLHYSRLWIAPPRVLLEPPRCSGVEEAHFTSADGTPLYGLYLHAAAGAPAIILCHGYQRSIEETFALACDLHARGFNALAFDFRGCGRSGGRYTSIGYYEPLDIGGAIAWVRSRTGGQSPIGMLGVSMGGSVALMAAADYPEVGALVTDSAFSTLAGAIAQRFAGLRFPVLQIYRLSMLTAERLCRARAGDVRPVDAAPRLETVPVLLIHGTADAVVPYEHALHLNRALPGPHELWTLPDVGHTMARFVVPEEYTARVCGFFDRHLRATDVPGDEGPGSGADTDDARTACRRAS